MAQWRAERPDLDVAPLGVIARLHRLAARLTEELVAVYAQHGLGEGEFDVLAALRRAGAPYELAPGVLAVSTMVSSGAVTKRVDRQDGRGRVVALTEAGRELIDLAFTDHVANERRLLAGLSPAQRSQLADLLEQWGSALDAAD